MDTLIIGAGEIGLTLYGIISEHYNCGILDLEYKLNVPEKPEILEICYPYSSNFVDITLRYIEEFGPRIVIVESTVAPGTCRKIQEKAKADIYHSPIRGRHSKLREAILTFIKYISFDLDKHPFDTQTQVLDYHKKLGILTQAVHPWEVSELGKLLSTAQYGVHLALADEMEKICKKFKVSYDETVNHFNDTYNDGYKSVGEGQLSRPILSPPHGKIGGHCVVPNAKIIDEYIETELIKKILDYE